MNQVSGLEAAWTEAIELNKNNEALALVVTVRKSRRLRPFGSEGNWDEVLFIMIFEVFRR
jgi:hypothetical protein